MQSNIFLPLPLVISFRKQSSNLIGSTDLKTLLTLISFSSQFALPKKTQSKSSVDTTDFNIFLKLVKEVAEFDIYRMEDNCHYDSLSHWLFMKLSFPQ